MVDVNLTSQPNQPTVAASANLCLESFQIVSSWTHMSILGSSRGLVNGKHPKPNASSVLDEAPGQCFGDIAIEISHLNKMSNLIRRASKETQILQASVFQIKDDDGNDVEPLLLLHFKRHIGDRFSTISDTIQQRLAHAMLLRRKRILYRRNRQGNVAIQLQETAPKVSISFPDSPPTIPSAQGNLRRDYRQSAGLATPMIAPSQIKSATTLQPDKFKVAALSPAAVSTTETVALGNHEFLNFPLPPGLTLKRKYEQLKSQRLADHQAELNKLKELYATLDSYENSTLIMDIAEKIAEAIISAKEKLKDILKADLQAIGEITCPYCFYALPSEETLTYVYSRTVIDRTNFIVIAMNGSTIYTSTVSAGAALLTASSVQFRPTKSIFDTCGKPTTLD
ncbi:hypothetical protein V8C37DRAFT_406360 [Trichoderma ceciliae]